MRGDEKERYCSKCSRTVVNLSLLTETQRTTLLATARPGELCVAYFRRLSGEGISAETLLTRSESRALAQFRVTALALGAVALTASNAPAIGRTTLQAQQSITTVVTHARNQLVDDSRQLIERLKERFGEKKKPQPLLSFTLGMIACPPSPPPAPTGPVPPPATPSTP
jgi:hypothetical protein